MQSKLPTHDYEQQFRRVQITHVTISVGLVTLLVTYY